MIDENDSKGGWKTYRPTKTLWFWSCAGAAVATTILGFTWGGWVTGGTLENRVAEASETAGAELAATICVQRFVSAPDARAELAAFMDESRWSRDSLIADGGWTTPLGFEAPIAGAADLCAERLAEVALPPVAEEAALGGGASAADAPEAAIAPAAAN